MSAQLTILIFFHMFASTWASLESEDFMETDATFFPFRVLRYPNVQTYDELEQATSKYLCPPETSEDIELMEEYKRHAYTSSDCYLDKEFKDNESKMCKKEPEPMYMAKTSHCNFIDDVLSDRSKLRISYRYCGSRKSIKKFMKERIPIDDSVEIAMYHVCWDRNTKKTSYTEHKIRSYGLFGEEKLQKEQAYESSTISTESYFLSNAPFSRLENAYKNQPESPDRVVPRFMVPKEHMVFAPEKRATFHYINTAPLLKKLIPLMDLIDNRIKNFAIQSKKLLTIYTTAFHNSLISVPRYISNQQEEFSIPNIWCKVVHYEVNPSHHLGVAIIIINMLEFNANLPNAICEKPYQCNLQEWTDDQHIIPTGMEKHAFCCQVSEIIAHFYPLNVYFSDVLRINSINFLSLF